MEINTSIGFKELVVRQEFKVFKYSGDYLIKIVGDFDWIEVKKPTGHVVAVFRGNAVDSITYEGER